MNYRRWKDREKEFLRNNKGKPNKYIADKLDRTVNSVAKQKARMGLTDPKANWKEGDKYKVETIWYRTSPNKTNELGRSFNSIKKMAYKMNLGKRYDAGGYYLTTGDVGEIVGLHANTIRNYVLQGRLRATFYGKKRIARITPDDLIDFIKENKEYLIKYGAEINKDLILPYENTYEVIQSG